VRCSTGHGLAHGLCRSSARAPGFRTPRTLASPTLGSATPATAAARWRTRQWCALRRSSGYLRASRALRHQRMERQAPMMPLSFSSNCGGPMPARDASPQTVCRWVPCGRDHTTKTNYVVCAHGHRWVFGSCGRFVFTTCSARGFGNTPCAGSTRSA